jgi:hypothetical protein
MFAGYSTLGAVALRIMADNLKYDCLSATRLPLYDLIERVCFEHTSVMGRDQAVSYVWWWIDGEGAVDYNRGDYFYEQSGDYFPIVDGEFEPSHLIGDWTNGDMDGDIESAMLRMGIDPFRRCLSRVREKWSRDDYTGESDADTITELLYVEPLRSSTITLPIPIPDLWQPAASMMRFRLCP